MSKILRIAGIAGIVAPLFVFACIIGSVASWLSFSWMNNALSDLGVQWGLTSTIFNVGLVLGGFLFMVFASGLLSFLGKRWIGKLGAILFLVACAALVGIGVFNETFSPTHYIVSVMLFVFMPLSLLVFAGASWLEGKRGLSIFTLVLGLVATTIWVLEFTIHYFSGVAIPEFISGSTGPAWTIVVSYLMLKSSKKIDSL